MSDPPYYTACPNPFLADFVAHYGRPHDPDEEYQREPYAVDVSVGKTDLLYRAHPYHTKVPHLAIVPSILHYTKPGDVVLDGFCGSGMTGVAAQWCGTAPESYRKELEGRWKSEGRESRYFAFSPHSPQRGAYRPSATIRTTISSVPPSTRPTRNPSRSGVSLTSVSIRIDTPLSDHLQVPYPLRTPNIVPRMLSFPVPTPASNLPRFSRRPELDIPYARVLGEMVEAGGGGTAHAAPSAWSSNLPLRRRSGPSLQMPWKTAMAPSAFSRGPHLART